MLIVQSIKNKKNGELKTMKKSLYFGMLLTCVAIFGAGCPAKHYPEEGEKVPGAVDAPLGENQSGMSQWQSPESFGGAADKDGWREADPSGNRLNMPIIYFAYDSDVLVPSETANLDKIAQYLNDKPTLGLVIEGHCDQRGTEEYNRALGERRANAIRAYLVSKGVADSKIKTISYGEDKPAVSGNGESVWKQNRRGVPVPMILPKR